MDLLNSKELQRYNRQIILPALGVQGQQRLKKAKVLVIGAGGLGCPVLSYLVAAGVGVIGIVDFDTITVSNLHRQVLYTSDDIGHYKVDVAKIKLQAQNPFTDIRTFNTKIDRTNAMAILADYDIVVDGSDNFATRYLINDACVLLDKPLVYGAVNQFEGQCSVFNLKNDTGFYGPNYRDLFPKPPPPGLIANCADNGVLGILPGIIGSFQALEVIKIVTQIGKTLSGRLFIINAKALSSYTVMIPVTFDRSDIKELMDYDHWCHTAYPTNIKDISVHLLDEWRKNQTEHQLIDVREPHEYDIVHMDGELIPMRQIPQNIGKIRRDIPVVMQCRSGVRSAEVIQFLQDHHGYVNLYNLTGGILAYADKIDPSLTKY